MYSEVYYLVLCYNLSCGLLRDDDHQGKEQKGLNENWGDDKTIAIASLGRYEI